MPTLTITKSVTRVIIMTLLAVLMTAVCLWAGLEADNWVKYVGWFGVLFFGIGIFVSPILYFKKRELLVLENEGFRDYSSIASIGGWGMAWEHVAQIRPGRSRKEVYVDLYNADLYFAKLPLRPRLLNSIN